MRRRHVRMLSQLSLLSKLGFNKLGKNFPPNYFQPLYLRCSPSVMRHISMHPITSVATRRFV